MVFEIALCRLKNIIGGKVPLSEKFCEYVIYVAAKAIQDIQKNERIVHHRDICVGNMFVDSERQVRFVTCITGDKEADNPRLSTIVKSSCFT